MPRLRKLKKTAKRLLCTKRVRRCARGKKGLDMFKCLKLLKKLPIGIPVLILMGCQSSTPPLPTATKPPADLVQPCPKLPKLGGGTGAEILPWSLQVVHLYNDCKARHKALSDTFQ
nr:MAG TPA: hypothetical protein [Caudoviricetes sp.]DAQ42905.1 MAG TPA: hypothetical protein [Caudoviricetes sp.]